MEQHNKSWEGLRELYELGREIGLSLGNKTYVGVTFKLLNAIRAGNWDKFQESLLHLIATTFSGDRAKLEQVLEKLIQNRSKHHAHALILGIIAGGEESGNR